MKNKYHAFISYSHKDDGLIAPTLQKSLEKFAKPWYKLRNLNIFRDEGSLSASPHLWDNITKCLDTSEYFVLMASPGSEKSKWVNKEVEYWLEHKADNKIILVLTKGSMDWDEGKNNFKDAENNSLPPSLDKYFKAEPFYIDLSHVAHKQDISLKNPIYEKEVLKLAAQLHGKEPKDLAGEAVRQHKKMVLVRNSAIILLSVLFVISFVLAIIADREWTKSVSNHLFAEAKSALSNDPTQALNLISASIDKFPTTDKSEFRIQILSEHAFYKTLCRQSGSINTVDFSKDGKWLIAGSDSGLTLFDRSLNQVSVLNYPYSIWAARFSPDGNKIITGSEDHKVIIWSMDHALKFHRKDSFLHRNFVAGVDFSADGKYAVSGGLDSMAWLHKLENGFKIVSSILLKDRSGKNVTTHNDQVAAVCFSPKNTGMFILTGSFDKTAKLWNTKGELVKKLEHHSNPVVAVDISPDNRLLTGSYDNTACIWNINGEVIHELKGHKGLIYSAVFSGDGKHVLTGSEDDRAILWDSSGRVIQKLVGHNDAVYGACIWGSNIEEMHTVTASLDGTVRKWIIKERGSYPIHTHQSIIYQGKFINDDKHIITCSEDKTSIRMDIAGNSSDTFIGHSAGVYAIAGSADLNLMLTGSYDNTVLVWQKSKKKAISKLRHKNAIHSLAMSKDGKSAVSGTADGKLYFWDLTDLNAPKLHIDSGSHTKVVNSIILSGKNDTMFTCSDDGFIKGWVLQPDNTFKCLISYNMESPVKSLAVYKMRSFVAGLESETLVIGYGSIFKKCKIYKHKVNYGLISSLAFSHNGQLIAAGSHNDHVYIFKRSKNKHIKELVLIGHKGKVSSVSFSKNDDHLLSTSFDNTVRLWDMKEVKRSYEEMKRKLANIDRLSENQIDSILKR
ncbi:MAG: TIR domain-containing protein [Flavobacteriales bacterium]|nr:TIR domain-containing protein [Flavobacteriales bacterium]